MKKILVLFTLFISLSFLYSQETNFDNFDEFVDTEFNTGTDSTEFDDLDSLFSEAEDIVVEEQKEAPKPISSNKSVNFSGFLDTDLGLGCSINPEDYFTPLGYFSLEHYTYISARSSDIFGIKGSIKTNFPNFSLSLHELYFDYLLLDFLYIQAGKRVITWGNTELIENNLLSDSASGASIALSFNLFNTNFGAVILSQINWGGGSVPGFSNMSFSGYIEKVLGKLQLNLFGRKWASEDPSHKNPALGLESKINLWGFDLYNQTITHIDFDLDNIKNTQFDRLYFTLGLMKDWENPRIGFIIEYQWIFYDKNLNQGLIDSHKIHFKGLVSRLFKSTSKIGLEFEHDFINNKGIITPGYIYYALPHVDINFGIPIYYSSNNWSVTPVIALTFEWNY